MRRSSLGRLLHLLLLFLHSLEMICSGEGKE